MASSDIPCMFGSLAHAYYGSEGKISLVVQGAVSYSVGLANEPDSPSWVGTPTAGPQVWFGRSTKHAELCGSCSFRLPLVENVGHLSKANCLFRFRFGLLEFRVAQIPFPRK